MCVGLKARWNRVWRTSQSGRLWWDHLKMFKQIILSTSRAQWNSLVSNECVDDEHACTGHHLTRREMWVQSLGDLICRKTKVWVFSEDKKHVPLNHEQKKYLVSLFRIGTCSALCALCGLRFSRHFIKLIRYDKMNWDAIDLRISYFEN